VDLNKLIERIRRLLLEPKHEWPLIAQEPASVGNLYKNHILILAALPAVLQFLQLSVFGLDIPFAGRTRIDIGTGLLMMGLSYGLTLATVYVVALIVDALAPTFNAEKNQVQALKAVAFAYTASWVASIGLIVPVIGILFTVAGGIYSIYLLYLGLPFTMKCPQDKAAGYTVITILVAMVLGTVVSVAVGGIVGLASAGLSSMSTS
jgi:hypothetical protein